jgi:hypothetical protein
MANFKVAYHSFVNAPKHEMMTMMIMIIIIIIIIIGNVLENEFPLTGFHTNQRLGQNPRVQEPQVLRRGHTILTSRELT